MQSNGVFQRYFRVLVLWVFVTAEGSAGSAHAFGTIAVLGQHNEHQRITRLGLRHAGFGKQTLDALAGTKWRFGAVGAPDKPFHGMIFRKEAHCDGGDYLDVPFYRQAAAAAQTNLANCRQWIIKNLDVAVEGAGAVSVDMRTAASCNFKPNAGNSAKCKVLASLGLAFHAAQDFYSHSNWTDEIRPEQGGAENPPGLGNIGLSPWLDPRRDIPFPHGLMTGCWEGTPEFLFCNGVSRPPRVQHKNLSKDFGVIDPTGTNAASDPSTPRGKIGENFDRAVRAAAEDTDDKWDYFRERVLAKYGQKEGRLILCVITSDSVDGCNETTPT